MMRLPKARKGKAMNRRAKIILLLVILAIVALASNRSFQRSDDAGSKKIPHPLDAHTL